MTGLSPIQITALQKRAQSFSYNYTKTELKKRLRQSPFNPNNAELIDVFLDSVPPTSKKTGYSIHWTGSGREIAKAILFCEQKIVQRLPFQSKEIEEEFYLQLNLLGKSKVYAKAMRNIKKVARNNSPVFVRGERDG